MTGGLNGIIVFILMYLAMQVRLLGSYLNWPEQHQTEFVKVNRHHS